MNFDEPEAIEKDPNGLLPDGEHVGKILSAKEEVMTTWEKTPTCLIIELKVLDYEVVRSITPCWRKPECAAIFKAAGIDPVGEVMAFDLIQKKVAFTAIRTVSKTGKEFVKLDAFRCCTVAAPVERQVNRKEPVRIPIAKKVNEDDIAF